MIALQAHAINLTPLPPYLSEIKGSPMIMLNMSRDHQLFYKAYNEYSDLDGDGIVETQYKHSYAYYGYFDNQRCYSYDTGTNRFVPTRKVATDGYCNYGGVTTEWAGNFMNWATMTRMDVVRRILYGGLRSTDDSIVSGASLTVLERAHLTTDAHAFAKYYLGADISKLTPFNQPEITLCNASFGNTAAPSILVANGNYALWSANERWQCYWKETLPTTGGTNGKNGNVPALTGLNAQPDSPIRANVALGSGVSAGVYTARVEVCKTGLAGGFTDDETSRCKLYPLGNYKPVGLLQKFGEKNEAAFGLMTGSYDHNIAGGVLRKNVATFTDEVDIDDGQFKPGVNGIVSSLNKIKIYGYNYSDGTYLADGAGCNFQQIGLTDGQCASWGNPLGEIYLESLRYLAGKTPTAAFISGTPTKDTSLGLTISTWSDPFATSTVATFGDRLCRRSSIVNFNASVTSYDNDQWSSVSSITSLTTAIVDNYTNQIGLAEDLYSGSKKWSIGRNGVDNNGFCSDKALTATGTTTLANATGICPEAPTQYGGYKMAGAALWAHVNPIRQDFTIPANNRRAFRIDTYGVALATGNPRIKIPVPGQLNKFVFISPAYRLGVGAGGGGTLVDFKVVNQTATAGKYFINWEDSEQGGDFDQDVIGTLEYSVNTATSVISVKTYAAAQATANGQGFGYAITGTTSTGGTTSTDGAHFHSGILGFNYNDPRNITVTPTTNLNASGGCNNCQVAQTATTAVYKMVGVSAAELQDPLWYAAKYGGFDRDKTTTYTIGAVLPIDSWDLKNSDGSTGADGTPDNFFYAVDPSQLEKSLQQVFSTILKAGGAAPAAASARTDAGGYAYKSTQSIKPAAGTADADASGQFTRSSFQSDGNLSSAVDWDAGLKLTVQNWDTGRNILSLASTGQIPFRWVNLDASQKTSLRTNPQTGSVNTVAIGQNRLNWIRGDNTNETAAGGLRARTTTKLGAIINSTPWFVGAPSAGYSGSAYGGVTGNNYGTFRTANAATNAVFVGANDGMLHAIDGASGNELFAYVPRAMYPTTGAAPYSKLSAITDKNFALGVGTDSINVDGSVMAADVQVGGTNTWSTYLFGSFGRGGKGVYALNITAPQSVTEASTNVVKWEFSEATGDPDMGYIVGRPTSKSNGQPFQTGYMANGKWAAIYGNGYNSTSGKAALFILFANGPTGGAGTTTWVNGTDYIKITAGVGGADNGLAMATAVDANNDGVIDYIYAGDLKGNVWKFDVRDSNPANWAIATTGNVPLYQATTTITGSTTVVAQPITTVVQPFPHPSGGYQLVFGTGKSLESNDYPSSVSYTNTVYGIYDKPANTTTLTVGLTDLVYKSTQLVTTAAGPDRQIQNNTVDYTTKKGWYFNLSLASEGLIFNMIATDINRASLKALAPDGVSDGCRVDSTGIPSEIDPISGSAITNSIEGALGANTFSSAGIGSSNSFETGRGGIYRKPPLPDSPAGSVTCTAGDAGCVCNGAGCFIMCTPGSANCFCNPAATQCVYCTDPTTCNKPWENNSCVYRKLSALGNGDIETTLVYGACNDGRLTWREIFRNR